MPIEFSYRQLQFPLKGSVEDGGEQSVEFGLVISLGLDDGGGLGLESVEPELFFVVWDGDFDFSSFFRPSVGLRPAPPGDASRTLIASDKPCFGSSLISQFAISDILILQSENPPAVYIGPIFFDQSTASFNGGRLLTIRALSTLTRTMRLTRSTM